MYIEYSKSIFKNHNPMVYDFTYIVGIDRNILLKKGAKIVKCKIKTKNPGSSQSHKGV